MRAGIRFKGASYGHSKGLLPRAWMVTFPQPQAYKQETKTTGNVPKVYPSESKIRNGNYIKEANYYEL